MNNEEKAHLAAVQWLVGTTFVSIEYAAGIRLRLERDDIKEHLPNVIQLDVKSTAWFGNKIDWAEYVGSFSAVPRHLDQDVPVIIYKLTMMIGTKVKDVVLHDNSSISIENDESEILSINGTEDIWEESWTITDIGQSPETGHKTIACYADGEISFE